MAGGERRKTADYDGHYEPIYVEAAGCWAVIFFYNAGDPRDGDFEYRDIPSQIMADPRTGKTGLDGVKFRWNLAKIKQDNLTEEQARQMANAL